MPITDDPDGKIYLKEDAYLFARRGIYYLRINLPKRVQFIRSLKVKVDEGDDARKTAIAKGGILYDEIKARLGQDLPINKMTIPKLCELLIKEGEEGVKINQESGRDITRITGGRGVWTKQTFSLFKTTIDRQISPFFDKGNLSNKDVTQITQRDIDRWISWRLINFPEEAPSTFAKRNITMRHLFRIAQRMGERFQPPKIDDIPKEISKRRRPEISEDQYTELLRHVKDIYTKETDYSGKLWGKNQKYAYLFYQWLETINHTGIRPWNTLKNAIKMEHIQRKTDKDGNETLTLQRYEKNHAYVAIASPYWKRTLDRLEVFYKSFGISNDREYLFVHPETYDGNKIVKGNPIINFRRQWTTAMKHLGWNEGKTEQSERISPYGIRHRYAGYRLINNEISPIELAQIMGTSLKMISDIYLHYSSVANYARLTKGDLEANLDADFFHPETGMREGAVATNSRAHQIHHALWPDSIAAPDKPFDPALLEATLVEKGKEDLLIQAKEVALEEATKEEHISSIKETLANYWAKKNLE